MRESGRWVFEEIESGRVAGSGQILPLPPEGDDLELGYQFAPWAWGRGLAADAAHAPPVGSGWSGSERRRG